MALIIVEPETVPAVAIADPLTIAATDGSDDVQAAHEVRSCWSLVSRVPKALNFWAVNGAILEVGGDTPIETTVDVAKVVIPEMFPKAAVMVVVPKLAVAVAIPWEPCALLMAAIVVSDEVQVTDVVMSLCVLLAYVPVAVNCLVVPGAMPVLAGATLIDVRGAEGPLLREVPPPPLLHAVSRITSAVISIIFMNIAFMLFLLINLPY